MNATIGLRHLFLPRRPIMWIVPGFFLIQTFPRFFMQDKDIQALIMGIIGIFCVGIFEWGVGGELLSKPSLFCLPHAREWLRITFFIKSFFVGLIFSAIYTYQLNLSLVPGILTLFATISLIMYIFLFIAFMGLRLHPFVRVFNIILGLIFAVLIIDTTFLENVESMQFISILNTLNIMKHYPIPVFILFSSLIYYLWHAYDGDLCVRNFVFIGGPIHTIKKSDQLSGKPSERSGIWNKFAYELNIIFLSFIRKTPVYSSNRYTLFDLHKTLFDFNRPAIKKIFIIIFLSLILLPVLGYQETAMHLIYAGPLILGLFIKPGLFGTLLLPGGRTERFRALVMTGFAAGFIVGGYTLTLYALSSLLGAYMPVITTSWNIYYYSVLPSEFMYVPLIVIGLMLFWFASFPEQLKYFWFGCIPGIPFLLILRVFDEDFLELFRLEMCVVVWIMFIAAAWIRCRYGSLVKKPDFAEIA